MEVCVHIHRTVGFICGGLGGELALNALLASPISLDAFFSTLGVTTETLFTRIFFLHSQPRSTSFGQGSLYSLYYTHTLPRRHLSFLL